MVTATVMVNEKFKGFFQKRRFENPITVDLHSHLLPGIDDGVKTLQESLDIIKVFKSLGYTKLITTPHIVSDNYPNTKSIIEEKLSEVKKAVKKSNIEIEIEAGAEHYIDMDFLNALEKDEVVPFSDKYILFETSYLSEPLILKEAIFDMQSKGYIPVLAHPERYQYMYDNIGAYKELKELGVLFQSNILSLKNFASPTYKMFIKLMEYGMIDYIGSDAHRLKHALDLSHVMQTSPYQNLFKKNKLLNNLL